MGSLLRRALAKRVGTKLLLKSILYLTRLDFFRFQNALEAYLLTLRCELTRWIKNSHRVMCNCCGWTGNEFFPHNTTSYNAMGEICPRCYSIPRYRLLLDFLKHELRFFDQNVKILEVGPNRSLQKLCLENKNFEYVSVDLNSPQSMMKMDVTELGFEDACFDVVLCVSVLQYVENDRKALQELYRVLKPDGYVIIASGIDERREKTIEYGKPNPTRCYTIRMYGRDIGEMFERVGFRVRKFDHARQLSEEYKERFGMSDPMIYYLTKP